MEEDNHHALPGDFDPLLIGILGCFAGVFMVAAYHYVTTRCNSPNREVEDESQGNNAEPWRRANESNSALLPTYRHAGNCKIDGTCAVCLSEFGDGEMIRVLPECLHSFHAPCIDMWLYSHTSCPLCRANTRLLPRRYVPSASHSAEVRLSISSTSETRQAHEDISPAPIHVPFLDDDPLPRTQASNTPHDDDERNLPELLAISSSHSDEDSQPVPTSAPSTSVTIPLIISGDPDPLPASPVWHTLHSDPDLPRFTPTPGTNENIPAQVSSTPSQEDDPMSRSNGE